MKIAIPGDKLARPRAGFGPDSRISSIKTAFAPAARQRLDDLEDQITQAQADRDRADADFLVKAQQVVAGVLADSTEGPDSALYEAMGYRRKSERKSGLTRKRNPTPTTTS